MKTETVKIDRGQYLMDVLPLIPANTILNKKLTGLGATYGEIKANRHSIIIEPNVPVIAGKCNSSKHKKDNLFGVYEGVFTKDIIDYLESNHTFHKILTTPESFRKVREAFAETGISMYTDCFLLFDECQKIVQDVAYREDIALPVDDFFLFENKAFVSATPIVTADPRFEQQGFKIIQIEPAYEYKKKIDLIVTNNLLSTIRIILNGYPVFDNACICFFLNSTDTIEAIIKQIDITNESAVFCSPKSVGKLKERKFNHAYSQWDIRKMKTFNFFTSRFFSALDMELDCKPDVIMLSDIYYAEHSMIDPNTEAIQITGRFRNGVSDIKHITNTNKNIMVQSEKQINRFLSYHEDGYMYLKTLAKTCTNLSVREILNSVLEFAFYHKFLNPDGSKNYFALENYKDEAKVKSYYNAPELLLEAYQNSSIFIPAHKYYYEPLGDFERLKRERNMSVKDKQKEIVSQMELLDGQNGNYPNEMLQHYRDILYQCDSFIVEAYEVLGKEMLEALDYSRPKIREAMQKEKDGNNGFEVQQAVYNSFKEGEKYTVKDTGDELKRIYTLFNLNPAKSITGQTIKEFFFTKDVRIKDKRGLLLVNRRI